MKKVLLLATVFLTSCYVTKYGPPDPILNTYIGKTEHAILLQYGPPTKTTSDGLTGKILDYEESRYTTIEALNTDPYSSILTTSQKVKSTFYLQFFINAESKVYAWRSNLLGEPYRVKSHLRRPFSYD